MQGQSMGDHLKTSIEEAGQKAGRLYWTDLHVHSPESHDFNTAPAGLEPHDYPACAQWFLEEISTEKTDLQVLAITDHFKCRIACEAARLGPGHNLLVLPGMELSVRCTEFHDDNIHLLVLFPPECTSEDVYSLVDALSGPSYEHAGAGSYISRPVTEILRQATQRGALCIAAHVNSSDGMRHFIRRTSLKLVPAKRREQRLASKTDRTSKEETELSQLVETLAQIEDEIQKRYLTFLGTCDLAAVQVAADDVVHYTADHCEPLGMRPIACLIASDAHSPCDVGAPGKATLLRMGELSFRAVEAALGDPETRVRFSYPSQERIIIKGIHFTPLNGTTGGFFGDTAIAFSENLTCIIGPRGSGKSAIMEAIRFALDQPLHREEKLCQDAQQRLEAVLPDTQVQLWISPAAQNDIVIQQSLGSNPHAEDLDGQSLNIDPTASAATRVMAYGWSEIEQLARDWAAQRELLDGAAPELRALRNAITTARSTLQYNRSNVVAAARRIQQYNSQLTDLPDVERELQVLDTPELCKAFEDAERTQRGETLITHAEERLEGLLEAFLDTDTGEPKDLAAGLASSIDSLFSEAEQEGLNLPSLFESSEFQNARERLGTALQETCEAIQSFLSIFSQARQAATSSREEAEQQAEQKLLAAFRADIDAGCETEDSVRLKAERRNELKNKHDELLEVRRKRHEERTRTETFLRDRTEKLVPALAGALKNVSNWRSQKAAEITKRLSQFAARAPVRVEIDPFADRSDFARHLYDREDDEGLLKGSRIYAFSERNIADAIAQSFLPWELTSAIRHRTLQPIEAVFRSDEKGDAVQDRDRLFARLDPLPQSAEDYDPSRLDVFLQIEETVVDDRPKIMLEGAPIETLSPGQRCTALMPIILTEGDCPLLIDQPEDNLDNTMVFHVLVDVLRRLKDHRQVIVATHNPNIPVSGDAEQVVVLRSRTLREGEVLDQGAVDLPELVRHVIEIMEGGDQAFETRARKYGYDIRPRTQPAVR